MADTLEGCCAGCCAGIGICLATVLQFVCFGKQCGLGSKDCCGGPRGCCDSCFSIDDDEPPKRGKKKQAAGGTRATGQPAVTSQPIAKSDMNASQTPAGDNPQSPESVGQTAGSDKATAPAAAIPGTNS